MLLRNGQPKHSQVRLRHFHPGATTHRRQGRAGEHPPALGHDPHQQPTFEPSAGAGEGKRTLDIQLGKHPRFQRYQKPSRKTTPLAPQWHQWLAGRMQNRRERLCRAVSHEADQSHTRLTATFVQTKQKASFSRLRRAEIGTHHHIAGPYLAAYADEMAWRKESTALPVPTWSAGPCVWVDGSRYRHAHGNGFTGATG
jgi:ISXO2-like transposase domain